MIVTARAYSKARPERVYALLRDPSSWPAWSMIDSFEALEGPAPDQLGARRNFRTGRVCVSEETTEMKRNERFSYRLLGGLPLQDYVASVSLRAGAGGTDILWTCRFQVGLLTRPFWWTAMRRVLGRLSRELAQAAEHVPELGSSRPARGTPFGGPGPSSQG